MGQANALPSERARSGLLLVQLRSPLGVVHEAAKKTACRDYVSSSASRVVLACSVLGVSQAREDRRRSASASSPLE